MKRLGICLIITLLTVYAKADIGDTVIAIKEVKTQGVRFGTFSTGTRITRIDSISLSSGISASLAELLAQHSLVTVRTYGPAGLANLSMRGGSSRHTAIIWNGFSLKNSMSGSLNFSTLPVGFVDEIIIQPGGSSTMYGSGASTGVIYLSDKLQAGERSSELYANVEMASFGTYSSSIKLTWKFQRFATRFKSGYLKSENNFKYTAQTFGRPKIKLKHASYERQAIAQQNTWLIGKRTKLETDVWLSGLSKEIPSLMSDAMPGTSEQSDKNLKGALIFSHISEQFSLKARSGIFLGEVYYRDTVPERIENRNKSKSFIQEVESKYYLNRNQIINLGFNHTLEKASSGSYIADTGRNRESIYGRYNLILFKKTLNLALEARQEFIKSGNIPFVFSFGGEYKFSNELTLKSNISKYYSLPVFDDLFWAEDAFAKGNPDLKPEYGWNYAAGIRHVFHTKSYSLENEINLYQNRIRDLIIWLPGNEGKWTPTNINNSITTGLEFSGNYRREFSASSKLVLNYMFAYTDARMLNTDNEADGNQRIYIPKYKSNVTLSFFYKKFNTSYTQCFESKRYFDDNGTLDAYLLSDINIGYNFLFNHKGIRCYIKVKNVYNVEYQYINGYAQPLRNYALGINISL